MRISATAMVAAVLLVALGGCRTAPIENVSQAPLTAPAGATITLEQVARIITAAGKDLGWVMEEVRPGEMTGTLTLRRHVAVVTITYDTSAFSITYKDSQNLLHHDQEIHRNYNNWVRNLSTHIQAEMIRLGGGR